jgi:hypothetical protein
MVELGDADAEALGLGEGDGDADAPASRDSPPPKITPMSRSVRRPPARAARIRSIQRGPRRGGGMILVVSDIYAQLSHPACRERQVGVALSLSDSSSHRARSDPGLVRVSLRSPERYPGDDCIGDGGPQPQRIHLPDRQRPNDPPRPEHGAHPVLASRRVRHRAQRDGSRQFRRRVVGSGHRAEL